MLKKQVIEEVTAEAKANSQKKNNEALKVWLIVEAYT